MYTTTKGEMAGCMFGLQVYGLITGGLLDFVKVFSNSISIVSVNPVAHARDFFAQRLPGNLLCSKEINKQRITKG